MHDGIELEKRKIPSAVICTDLFIPTARVQAAISGIPSYSFITIAHPISRLAENELRERAEIAAGQVMKLLSNE
ncbi:hypothetical protein ACFLVN_00285 [Chloroflexota bacterium]